MPGRGAQSPLLLLRAAAAAASYTYGVTGEVAMNRIGLTSVFESCTAGILGAAVLVATGCSDPAGGSSQATGGQAATGVGGSSSLGGRASSTGGAGTGVAGLADCTANDGLICVKAEGILNGVPFACVGQGISARFNFGVPIWGVTCDDGAMGVITAHLAFPVQAAGPVNISAGPGSILSFDVSADGPALGMGSTMSESSRI